MQVVIFISCIVAGCLAVHLNGNVDRRNSEKFEKPMARNTVKGSDHPPSFSDVDADGDNAVTFKEFHQYVMNVSPSVSENVTSSTFQNILSEVDANGNGKIDLEEYMKVINSQ